MNIVLGSFFRDSQGKQVTNWIKQCEELYQVCRVNGCNFRAVAVEGDSKDDTFAELDSWSRNWRTSFPLQIKRHHTGAPRYGSTEAPERMAALSPVGNALLDCVLPTDDVLLYVESDLLWDADDMLQLAVIAAGQRAVVSPLIMAGDLFYDIWAFRKDGERFSPFPPFRPEWKGVLRGQLEVDSVGSCLAIPAVWAQRIRMTTGALVEWCNNARAAGCKIYCNPSFVVRHPA